MRYSIILLLTSAVLLGLTGCSGSSSTSNAYDASAYSRGVDVAPSVQYTPPIGLPIAFDISRTGISLTFTGPTFVTPFGTFKLSTKASLKSVADQRSIRTRPFSYRNGGQPDYRYRNGHNNSYTNLNYSLAPTGTSVPIYDNDLLVAIRVGYGEYDLFKISDGKTLDLKIEGGETYVSIAKGYIVIDAVAGNLQIINESNSRQYDRYNTPVASTPARSYSSSGSLGYRSGSPNGDYNSSRRITGGVQHVGNSTSGPVFINSRKELREQKRAIRENDYLSNKEKRQERRKAKQAYKDSKRLRRELKRAGRKRRGG